MSSQQQPLQFRVLGMDRAEEAAALKQELVSVVDRLTPYLFVCKHLSMFELQLAACQLCR